MNLQMFPVPLRRGYIVPTSDQFDDTERALFSFFDDTHKNAWALESGLSKIFGNMNNFA